MLSLLLVSTQMGTPALQLSDMIEVMTLALFRFYADFIMQPSKLHHVIAVQSLSATPEAWHHTIWPNLNKYVVVTGAFRVSCLLCTLTNVKG